MHRLLIILVFVFAFSAVTGQNKEVLHAPGKEMLSLGIGDLTMVVDVNTGARIVSLKLGDHELLGTTKEHSRFYGSTLWLSPEAKWRGRGLLDNGAYSVDKFSRSDLFVTSGKDTLRGFVVMKQFTVIPEDTSIFIRYIIKNISKQEKEVAPWEVTRVPTGGLAFVPKGSPDNIPTPNKTSPLLTFRDSIGTIWYPYDSIKSSSQKMFMDGGEGWMAYVRNRVIFIKKVPLITPDQTPPTEKNIEIYVNGDRTYIELENHGVYQKLAPGESLFYDVRWFVRRLPAVLNVEIGNEALLEYVRNILKGSSLSVPQSLSPSRVSGYI